MSGGWRPPGVNHVELELGLGLGLAGDVGGPEGHGNKAGLAWCRDTHHYPSNLSPLPLPPPPPHLPHTRSVDALDPDLLSQDTLRKYITYAKQTCKPKLQAADYDKVAQVGGCGG